MELIGLGEVTYVAEDGWWCSEPVSVGALGGVSCVLSFDDVEGTGAAGVVPERLVDAAREMIAADDRALRAATDSIFDYYRDTADEFADDDDVPDIGTADEVWQYVTIGSEVHFSIDQGHAYASIE